MPLKCAACTADMTSYKDDLTDLVVDNCFYCGGIWFDRGELRRIFSSPKLKAKFLFPTTTFRAKVKNAPEQRVCCRCEEVTALTEIQAGGVNVDECPTCRGIWLDAGEIIRLVESLSKGKFKAKSETASQMRWGKFDQTILGQVARMIMVALKSLVK